MSFLPLPLYPLLYSRKVLSGSVHPLGLQYTRLSWPLISPDFAKFMSTVWMLPSNHLLLCCSLLPSIFPSFRVFSNESMFRIRWPKYWSFSITPSNKYSGLICLRIDWFDLHAVQGTLQSLLRHHNLKAWIHLVLILMVQLSHPYMTTGENHSSD